MLVKNTLDKKLQFMTILSLKNFTGYNEKHGWKAGDDVLKKVAKCLHENYKKSFVFRVYGDDFIILSEEEVELSEINAHIDTISKNEIKCGVKILNILDIDISKIEHLVNNIK
jgi:diguanylate cyclase (GGDEF)-like protein